MRRAEIMQGLRELLAEQRAAKLQSDAKFKALEMRTKGLEMKFQELWAAEVAADKSPTDPVDVDEVNNGTGGFARDVSDDNPPEYTDQKRRSVGTEESYRVGATQSSDAGAEERDLFHHHTTNRAHELELASVEDNGKRLHGGWKRFIMSPRFDLAMGALIVLNTLVMSLQVEYQGRMLGDALMGRCEMGTQSDTTCPDHRTEWIETAFVVLEQFFSVSFFLELLVRVSAFGPSYYKTPLNLCDAFVVIISCAEAWILTPLGGSGDGRPNIALLRLVKLVRLSKVLRVVRVMKAFKALRVLVAAVVASIGAVAWGMALLFVLELIGAIFLAQVLNSYMMNEEIPLDTRIFLWDKFGTWWHAMLSIFEVTMAPGGFVQYRRLYDEIHWSFAFFFVAYNCLVTFAVVRVITAMFLKATLSASDSEERKLAIDKARMFEDSARRLQAKIDAEGKGGMDKEELAELLSIPKVREWLSDMNVSRQDARRLYTALDRGNHAGIKYTDFIGALLRMTGAPRALDVTTISHESYNALVRLKRLEKTLREAGLIEEEIIDNQQDERRGDGTPTGHDLRDSTRDSVISGQAMVASAG